MILSGTYEIDPKTGGLFAMPFFGLALVISLVSMFIGAVAG